MEVKKCFGDVELGSGDFMGLFYVVGDKEVYGDEDFFVVGYDYYIGVGLF